MAKTYVHELSSFGQPTLERYPFMGRDNNSLDEIELEEKNNWASDRKIHHDLIKKGYSDPMIWQNCGVAPLLLSH